MIKSQTEVRRKLPFSQNHQAWLGDALTTGCQWFAWLHHELSRTCTMQQARILSLRISELHECSERLGLRKYGKKAELQERLINLFKDSEAL